MQHTLEQGVALSGGGRIAGLAGRMVGIESAPSPAVPQQQFNGPVGQVTTDVIHNTHQHHHWADTAPPDDPAMSLQCPQCQRLTWRYSRHCVHCQLDLVGWCRCERRRLLIRAARRLFHSLAKKLWQRPV